MSPVDAELASPTIAQLYLEQGHPERARTICREVIERDPTNGYALALHERLRRSAQAQVEARFVSTAAAEIDIGLGELELNWSVPRRLFDDRPEARLDVVVAISTARTELEGLRYTSIRCLDLRGSRRLEVPRGPASAAVALILSAGPLRRSLLVDAPRPKLRVLAVATPLSW